MRELSQKQKEDMFKSAQTWEQSNRNRAKQSAAFAWTLAIVMGGIAIASVGAVAMLAPLKKVEPYVVQVDRTTGQTNIIKAYDGNNPMTFDESFKRHIIAQYVINREGWIPLAEDDMAHAVLVMSSQAESERFKTWFDKNNPQSPQKRFATTPFVKVEVTSVSFINNDVAQVRYNQIVYPSTGQAQAGRYIATITYKITNKPSLESDLRINPLGFEVQNYQTAPEN